MEKLGLFDIGQMIESGGVAAILMLIGFIVTAWLYRKQLGTIFGSIFGNRNRLDDYSIVAHKHREEMHENDNIFLEHSKGIILLPLGGIALLFNPLISIGIMTVYVINRTYKRVKLAKSFDTYDATSIDNRLFSFLNHHTQKIEFVIENVYFLSAALVAVGAFFNLKYVAYAGVIMAFMTVLVVFLGILEASSLRRNFKPVEAFRSLRLLQNSGFISKSGLFLIAGAGFVTSFTDMAGFSVAVWAVTGVKLLTDMIVNSMLQHTDRISETHQEIEQRDYAKIENYASYPNPISHSRGYKWTEPLSLKMFQLAREDKIDRPIFLDNYGFYPEMTNRSALIDNPLIRANIERRISMRIDALKVTQQLVIIGGMGSGKTEYIHNIIEQNHKSGFTLYQSIVFNDIKGDYRSRFYRPEKDLIVSLFDERGAVWDLFAEMQENIEAGSVFISNLFEEISGKEKDFFSGRAKQLTSIWCQEAFYESAGDSHEAWEIFFDKISKYETEIEGDKTKSSIMQTINIATEILGIMKYQITVEKRKTFSLAEFVIAKDVQMFLSNDKRYAAKLTPYLNGIWASLTNAMMAKKDTKEHLVLNVLDEFLTMGIDENTRKTMMTATRSKGAANLIGIQNLVNDDKLVQELDSSRYAMIVFRINDDYTIKKVLDKLGNQEMLTLSASPKNDNSGGKEGLSGVKNMLGSLTPEGKKNTHNFSMNSVPTILSQQLQSMPEFHHITFIPGEDIIALDAAEELEYFKLFMYEYDEDLKEASTDKERVLERNSGILYLGYTPQATLDLGQEHTVDWDMEDYYAAKNKMDDFKKRMGSIDERTAFVHYNKVHFAESGKEAQEYMVNNGLVGVDRDLLFRKFNPNIISKKRAMERFTLEELSLLVDRYYEMEDADKMFDLLEDNELFGAIELVAAEIDEAAKKGEEKE